MSNMLALLAATGGGAPKLYADDVFQSYTRVGTGASATVTTNIDMTKGFTLHSKVRSAADNHAIYDSARGVTFDLATNTTAAQTTQVTGLTAVSATGHTIGTLGKMNASGDTYVDWVFRQAAKFHKVVSVTKTAGSNATVDLSTLGTVGMVKVKRTDATGSWYVWHRSLTAGKLLIGETTAAEATLGHITVVGTTLTLVNGVIADGTYHVEAYAHDTSADGLIQCGSFTTDGSGNATVSLGFELQYLHAKATDTALDWTVYDSSRGMAVNSRPRGLRPNLTAVEYDADTMTPTATGFNAIVWSASTTYAYMAIRRPNKPPTSGTQVYNAIARTGTGAAATVTGVGFAPDLVLSKARTGSFWAAFFSKLVGAGQTLRYTTSVAEESDPAAVTAFLMDGVSLGSDGSIGSINIGATNYINYYFRRAVGVCDVVCDAGTGVAHTIAHGLGATPEMVIRKRRNGIEHWRIYSAHLPNTTILDETSAAKSTDTTAWNSASPTASVFTVGTGAAVNTNAATHVTYLFASLAGVSKCGSYTGTAATKQIDCGFTAGARFVLIKRTDAAGDWYVWDSVRGIIAGNDPYLLLNSTAVEVTTTDYIDPYAAGFELSSTAPAAINASGGNFIYLAIA